MKNSPSNKKVIMNSDISESNKGSNLLNSSDNSYKIYFGESNEYLLTNILHGDNKISTTKYTILSFFPKSLFLQFQKSANIYFLIVSIFSCMDFSPKDPFSFIATFAFVLIASQIKEAYEDYQRYKQDKRSNNKIVLKLYEQAWTPVKCSSLVPGDIVKIFKEEEIFADLLIIKSSNNSGYCFVDTKNLDGETNLKEKCSVEEFKHMNETNFTDMTGSINCEKPNEFINSWEGIVTHHDQNTYASIKNLALKGSLLKNVEYIVGIVVYSGKNTKIMKNSKQVTIKFSKIIKLMNNLLNSLFAFDIIICVVFAVISLFWRNNNSNKMLYIYSEKSLNLNDNESPSNNFIILFLTFFVKFSQIIPISLYVALEIIKIIQKILIYYDNDIYCKETNKPTISRSLDLIDELGQVEFIFSDKTGTLTQNNMVLKKCYVNKKIYGILKEKDENTQYTLNGDLSIWRKLMSNDENDDKDKELLTNFFILLTLCHSVFPEKTDRGIVYQGASPDDVALVQGAKQLGFEFMSREFNDLIIKNHVTKDRYIWEQVMEMPFDSDRKRMSVIVRNKITKEIILFTKGADYVMLGDRRIIHNEELYEEVDSALNIFSKEGLRTLIMGMRILDQEYYEIIKEKIDQSRNLGKDMNFLYDEIERELEFIGISAVEDKLQDGVPETIHTLISCNIKMFVLTGDKQDTTIEIARSCRLIHENMEVIILSADLENIFDKLNEILTELQMKVPSVNNSYNDSIDLQSINEKMKENFENDLCIVINGTTLDLILTNRDYSRLFVLIAVAAKIVLCCRVSPKQKAKVIRLIKDSGSWTTLAIGDGANDIPMIMEADVGIGIQGKEGTQAVRSSDYAVCQFRFLEKLLLFHGRNGYIKISRFITYYFYKNIFLTFTELLFNIHSGFSGQIFFADNLSNMYNAFFTSWPCLFTFSLEKDHDVKICKKFPILYKGGQINYYFRLKVFWTYILYALIHGLFAFYIPSLSLNGIINGSGDLLSTWEISTLSFSLIISVATMKLLLITDFWNAVNLSSSFLSIAFYYFTLFMMSTEAISKSLQNELIGICEVFFGNYTILMILVFAPFICIIPDLIFKQLQYNLFPTPSQYILKYMDNNEFHEIMNSKSNFIKSFSNLESNPIQKMRVIDANNDNIRLQINRRSKWEIKNKRKKKKNLFNSLN